MRCRIATFLFKSNYVDYDEEQRQRSGSSLIQTIVCQLFVAFTWNNDDLFSFQTIKLTGELKSTKCLHRKCVWKCMQNASYFFQASMAWFLTLLYSIQIIISREDHELSCRNSYYSLLWFFVDIERAWLRVCMLLRYWQFYCAAWIQHNT